MSVIALVNPKGGVGKTTLALNLGLFLYSQERNITFVDLDPQHSLKDWLSRRPKTLSMHHCIKSNANKLSAKELSKTDENSDYILDCPAAMNEQQLSKLLAIADVLLIPVSPSPVDLSALSHFFFQLAALEEHKIADKSMALIANRAKVYTRSQADTLAKIKKFKVPLIATLRDTQNYTLPAAKGMGIVDLPAYHTKADIESWQSIFIWLKQFEKVN